MLLQKQFAMVTISAILIINLPLVLSAYTRTNIVKPLQSEDSVHKVKDNIRNVHRYTKNTTRAEPLCMTENEGNKFISCGNNSQAAVACVGAWIGDFKPCQNFNASQVSSPICVEKVSTYLMTCGDVSNMYLCFPRSKTGKAMRPCRDLKRRACLVNGVLKQCNLGVNEKEVEESRTTYYRSDRKKNINPAISSVLSNPKLSHSSGLSKPDQKKNIYYEPSVTPLIPEQHPPSSSSKAVTAMPPKGSHFYYISCANCSIETELLTDDQDYYPPDVELNTFEPVVTHRKKKVSIRSPFSKREKY